VAELPTGFGSALADRYTIERELGRGGMAVVFLARDLKHDRMVALKVLRPEIAVAVGGDRFIREIRIAARLQHPHILPLFDSGETGGLLYFSAPYVEGESLRQRLQRERQLPTEEALAIARQVASALSYAHGQGVVHRDIKPDNILLADGEAIVADFGIALAVTAAGGERLTETGLALGTPAYMSPEQAAGGESVDRRSDVYSLGCVLYEMLAGEPPFSSPTPQAVLARQLHDTAPPLKVLRPTVPAGVEAAVTRALAKVPAERYDTAAQFAAALEGVGAAPRARARVRWRSPWVVAASVGLLIGLALVGRMVLGRTAYAAGQKALAEWDLARAAAEFRKAIKADPRLAEAHLWLAQSEALGGQPARVWHASALSAVAFARNLPSWRDSALAFGLLALGEERYPEACERYRAALRRDTLDVFAWFGLGECQRLDRTVLRDPASPTGWRFRGSFQGSVAAYQRALEIAPSLYFAFGAEAYTRLSKILPIERFGVRQGRAPPPDTTTFLAYPALDHDTLALQVYRQQEAMVLPPPSTMAAAVTRGRALLRELVRRWLEAFPGSGRAHAAMALTLEFNGSLDDSGSGRPSALSETREARRLETDPLLRVRFALDEIRLHLKLLDFARARRLADSILSANPRPDSSASAYLACAAALVGRAHVTAALLVRTASDTSFADVPLPVKAAALKLAGYASLGAPAESLVALERRMDTLLLQWVDPERRETVRHALMDLSVMLAFPDAGMSAATRPHSGYFIAEAQWLLARGDTAAARGRLAATRRDQDNRSPVDFTPIPIYPEALLFLAVHDTADAEWLLGKVLDNLPAARTALISEPWSAGSLVRAMVLRAQVAARRGDGVAARRWAAGAAALWSGADPELRSLVDSLRGR
jgi:hypothetical protein